MISLVIPIYKVEKYIEKCLRSCLNQKDINADDYEIIVINDGSPDKSAAIAKNVLADYPNCKVIDQPNKGLGGARNTGIENASGEYIWFIDSDDWIAPESLSILKAKIREYSFPDLIRFRSANVIENKYQIRQSEYSENISSGIKIFESGGLITCAPFQLIKRSVLQQNNLRFIEGIFHEDNEFMPRLAYFSSTVASINNVLYFVYQNPTSITRSINPKKSFDLIDVCNSLSLFAKEHKYTSKANTRMNAFISLSLNTALNGLWGQESEIQYDFNTKLSLNKHLFRHLIGSKTTKYIIEGILFYLGSNYIRTYNRLSALK